MLKKIAPFNLLLYSFLSWLFAYLIIPAHYIVKGDRFFPIFVFVTYNLCLIAGFLSVKKKAPVKIIPDKFDYFTVKMVFYIGIIGFVLQFIKLFFIDKVLTSNVYAERVANQSTEFNSGALGVIIALTFPFAIVAFLSVFYYYSWSTRKMKIMASLFALLYIADAFLNGARLPVAVIGVISLMVFAFYQAHEGNLFKKKVFIKMGKHILAKIPKILVSRKVLVAVVILALCINFFKDAMIARLEYYRYTDVLSYWETQHESKMDADFKAEVNALNVKEKNKRVATYSLYHYFAHAPFEFQKLVNHVDEPYGIFYGKYELDVYFKFLRFFNIPVESRLEMEKTLYHAGYYITLWGPFYLDFGVFGFIIAFFLGYFIQKTYIFAVRRYLPAILMYSYIAIVLLASFHVSLVGGKYIYIFNAILIFWLLNAIMKAISKRLPPEQ